LASRYSFGDQLIRVYGSTAVNTGYYTWFIVDHHSSAMPQAPKLRYRAPSTMGALNQPLADDGSCWHFLDTSGLAGEIRFLPAIPRRKGAPESVMDSRGVRQRRAFRTPAVI
jgi:hypothetical protein